MILSLMKTVGPKNDTVSHRSAHGYYRQLGRIIFMVKELNQYEEVKLG